MIHKIRIRDLSADVTKHTTTKHKIIVYSVLAVLFAIVIVLICK